MKAFRYWMRRAAVATVAAASLFASTARAVTGEKFVEDLRAGEGSIQGIAALAYVRGFVDALAIEQATKGTTGNLVLICVPRGGSAFEAQAIIRAYLEANPSERYLEIGTLAYKALGRRWPCSP
jgi:hypothetical protein